MLEKETAHNSDDLSRLAGGLNSHSSNTITPQLSQDQKDPSRERGVADDLSPDYKQANRFFDVLTGSKADPLTFQFFPDKNKNSGKASFRHLKRSPAYAFLHKKQKQGCGVYVMVNAGDGKGRSKKNVVKVRALFVDLDGSPWEPAATSLKPHMRIESSPGRWHLYWLVKDCSLSQFKPIQQAIAKKFNGDKSCCDLPRVLRVPGFFHLKKEPVMTKLSEVNDFPQYSALQVIEDLGLELTAETKIPTKQQKENNAEPPLFYLAFAYTVPETGEVIDLTEWASRNPDFDIVNAIKPEYTLGAIVEGKQHICCPFANEHTEIGTDLASFIANADRENPSFTIHCMHSHCAARDRLEFLQAMLEGGWLLADTLVPPPLELRNPLWVSFPVNEISSCTEWSILNPSERRIALDLTFFAWKSDDGTIEDNDWKIAKYLGLSDDEWQEYRITLDKVGWLTKEPTGRLTNRIVKREFDAAQIAYSKSCAGGRKGGRKTQAKRRASSPPSTSP